MCHPLYTGRAVTALTPTVHVPYSAASIRRLEALDGPSVVLIVRVVGGLSGQQRFDLRI